MSHQLSDNDVANILAALRYWQSTTSLTERLEWVHFGDGEYRAYNNLELDELCEQINEGANVSAD